MLLPGLALTAMLKPLAKRLFKQRPNYTPDYFKSSLRKEFAAMVRQTWLPYRLGSGDLVHGHKDSMRGMVICYAHPTLNDPLIALMVLLEHIPYAKILVPVNIPWYESLRPLKSVLAKMGIILCPVSSPSTTKALSKHPCSSEVSAKLDADFLKLFEKIVGRERGICLLAPSAGRQSHLLKSYRQLISPTARDRRSIQPPTMGALTGSLRRNGVALDNIDVAVMAFDCPEACLGKLSVGAEFTVNTSNWSDVRSIAELVQLADSTRIDWEVVRMLTKVSPDWLIAPDMTTAADAS
jgi:hypothetical protein